MDMGFVLVFIFIFIGFFIFFITKAIIKRKETPDGKRMASFKLSATPKRKKRSTIVETLHNVYPITTSKFQHLFSREHNYFAIHKPGKKNMLALGRKEEENYPATFKNEKNLGGIHRLKHQPQIVFGKESSKRASYQELST